MLALAVGAVAVAFGLGAWALLSQTLERVAVRGVLGNLGSYEVENVRERELSASLGRRALHPVAGSLNQLSRRLTPAGYVQSVQHKLVLAGRPHPDTLDRYLAVRLVTVVLAPILALLFLAFAPVSGKLAFFGVAVILFVLLYGPDSTVSKWVKERKHEMQAQLPDLLDVLTISVEAGLGFEQALDRTVDRLPGPLSDEFHRMLGETRAGSSRADAMRALDDRTDVTEVRSFVLSILQADTFGVSIGRVLRSQADEMRIKRRQLAQEKAMKTPVKMLFPMVFCIFPSIFVVVIGPGLINVYSQFVGQ